MPAVVKFTYYHYHSRGLYACDQPGDQSGEYVPLAEHRDEVTDLMYSIGAGAEIISRQASQIKGLRRLVERLNEIGPHLFNIFDGNAHWKSTELEQLLADCRKALEGRE